VTFTVSAGPLAPVEACDLEPGCQWWNFNETGVPVGSYTLQCFDRTDSSFSVKFTVDITSSSWTFQSDGTTGYCASSPLRSGHTVYAVLSDPSLGSYQSDDFVWP
jgi:hypothetical protein